LENRKSVEYDLRPGRHAWLQVARGSVDVNGKILNQGDGAAISEESKLKITGKPGETEGEILLFNLA
jgi:redox-sensitive bicupin YhaK (pirin superfamily)